MSQPDLRLLDLEERLAADAAGWERDSLLARLRQARLQAKQDLDRGVPPAEYKRLMALVEACDSAIALVPQLWRRIRLVAATAGQSGA